MTSPYKETNRSTRIQSTLFVLFITILIFGGAFALYYWKGLRTITTNEVKAFEKISGLRFTPKERRLMLRDLKRNLASYKKMREVSLPDDIIPALVFNPLPPGMEFETGESSFRFSFDMEVPMPENFEDIAFYPVTYLAVLMKTGRITSTQLTKLYLERLKKYGPALECVITLTEDLAMEQARRADEEITAGRYKGPLHGIPWGAKDLLATKSIKTTWGAAPYKDRIIDIDATVVKRLEKAGAVLVAKLTMGALAWGDVWFGGKTRNPWDLEQGSSGSSAGSASATAAGLVGFAIGTETWGSIVSPSARCGVSGLRPTFGRVSRYGAMALSWSMDKIGPICRSVEDCALVFQAIYGPDGKDPSVIDLPFNWDPALPLQDIRIGYLKKFFEEKNPNKENDLNSLKILESLGAELIPLDLPNLPVTSISFILNVEAAAAFDEFTRSNQDDLLVRQVRNAWPNVFRQARLVPAVEYIQANRLRSLIIRDMAKRLKNIDVYICPSFGGNNLLLTNLTGHPAVVVPNGFNEKGSPASISFIGNLFKEGKTLRVAKAFQDASDFHLRHPDLDKQTKEDR